MPYVMIGTKVSLRSVSAGVARAGLPYFTAWLSTVDKAAVQRNILSMDPRHLRLRSDGLRRTNSNRQFQSYGKLTNRRTDNEIRVVLV